MAIKSRTIPPVCLGISIARLITGRLRLSRTLKVQTLKMHDGQEYTVFRQIRLTSEMKEASPITFIVRFKFTRLSHKANKIASLIPMLLITGYPGFNIKIYGVNRASGFWQGLYQWSNPNALEDYKQSFVYRMMNKRAIKSTISALELENQALMDYIEDRKT